MNQDQDTWNSWSKHVIEELKRLSSGIRNLDHDLNDQKLEMLRSIERLRSEIRLLKFQATIWGAFGGFVISAVVTAIVSKL